ncbi:MAG: sugar ABC transporter ATP-binding protein [Flexilinea sp.]
MIIKSMNICKRFGATIALDCAQVQLSSGQIHSIVGENGAGKSTLLKIIAAVYKADSGEITIDGKQFDPKNLLDASKQGVTIVFQESTINPYISVAENIFIGRLEEYNRPFLGINWKKIKKDAQEILDSMEAEIDVNKDINSLDLGQWKLVEVARALSYNPSVLLLDESTAFLNNKESTAFLKAIKNLRDQGLAIGFVSHHMNEIFEVSDRITVMRDGKFVVEFSREEATMEAIEAAMVGRAIGSKMYPPQCERTSEEVVIRADHISITGKLDDISFDLKKGEILGIGGLKDAGGESILDAIYGVEPISTGKLAYCDEEFTVTTPNKSLQRKISLVPGERTLEGLITDFTIKENLVMSALPRKGLIRDRKGENELAEHFVEKIKIKTDNVDNTANSLSGGNMQKVVIGKCLAINPNVLLLNNPTRGIDVSARQEIYMLMRELCHEGFSIIMLTEDLLELLGMSDRIILMRKKKISHFFEKNKNLSEEDMIGYIV